MARTLDRVRQDAADRLRSVTPIGARRALVKARLWARIKTAPLRTLPDALIIGAQRCGTSSLYKYLGRHPNVAPSLRKEIEYFSIDYGRGPAWYRAHFATEARRVVAGRFRGAFATFEATPDYLLDPRAPARAANDVPDAKLIAMLRDPVERAVSHYHHNRRLGHEPLSLEEAVRTENERIGGELALMDADPGYRAVVYRRFSYVTRGRYAEQLERWLEHYPRDRLLVLRSADLFTKPSETFARIVEFLELPEWEPPEFRNYSYANALDGDYPEPEPAVMEMLAERLTEPNRRLVELLGEEFRWDAAER
jgi:hypothetical protein